MNNPIKELAQIHALHQAGRLNEAKTAYLAALQNDPKNVEILHALGILCAQQDNMSDAILYLQTASQYEPDNPTIQLHLANMLKIQGLFSQAAQVLHETLHTHPNYVPALNNLGTVYYAQGKFLDAIPLYKDAIDRQPDYIDAYYNLGLALHKHDDLEAASDAYKKLLELSPDHFAARFHLACILMLQKKTPDALEHFAKIEADHPFHLETQTNLATCYLTQGALNEAKLHYTRALEITPEDTQILFNLGVINMQQGNIDRAIQHYQHATRINPDFFAAHNNLAVAFLAKQHVALALQHFQEALRLQPDNESIQYTVKMLAQNQRLLAAPSEYIKTLFDAYADHYEQHLLEALDYKIPKLLYLAIANVTKTSPHAWDILDLGCGTGLCGVVLKPLAKSLTGVDLSEKMLALAKEKNIYDELTNEHLSDFLKNKTTQYDLVIAGDVFVYIGELDLIFQQIHQALRPKGILAFNTEICLDEPFNMNQSGRFSHQKKYLEALAKKYHFKILSYKTVITRRQNNEPVEGHLYVLQKTA